MEYSIYARPCLRISYSRHPKLSSRTDDEANREDDTPPALWLFICIDCQKGIAIMNPIVEWPGHRKIDFNLKSKYVFRYSVVSTQNYSKHSYVVRRSVVLASPCRSS